MLDNCPPRNANILMKVSSLIISESSSRSHKKKKSKDKDRERDKVSTEKKTDLIYCCFTNCFILGAQERFII